MARKKSAAKKAKEAQQKGLTVDPPIVATEKTKASPPKSQNDLELVSSSEQSSSEEEDEYGELITDNIDSGINKVLDAIRTDPSKLLDKDVKFFDDETSEVVKSKKDKPMYLKDYHRMNILSGGFKDEDEENDNEYDNEFGTVDGEKPYVVEQREERNQLLSDIKSAFNEEESDVDSDDFLKKKERAEPREPIVSLPNPVRNEDEFLKSFLDSKAWIPTSKDKVINLDRQGEDDDEFEDAVEDFEHAYNFRYEDPNATEIVSYARTQATLRRDKSNSRKRQRERDNEEKEKKVKEKEEKIKKKETSKLNKAIDRMTQIKEAVGSSVSDETIAKVFGDSLLNDDFDDADWDSKMAQIFDEEYYGDETTKPEFSDLDIGDEEEDGQEEDGQEEHHAQEEEDLDIPVKKSKKNKLKDKKESKKQKTTIKEKAKKLVESNRTKIIDEIEEEERGRSKDEDVKFKYREVSPESYGLTNRDIFVADDKQLNTYIGIKKFAPYRPKELRVKDRRKYKKKRPLEEWRRDVFRDYKPKEEGDDNTIWLPEEKKKHKEDKHKDRKHNREHKKHKAD